LHLALKDAMVAVVVAVVAAVEEGGSNVKKKIKSRTKRTIAQNGNLCPLA
jgi:hypothetical protein